VPALGAFPLSTRFPPAALKVMSGLQQFQEVYPGQQQEKAASHSPISIFTRKVFPRTVLQVTTCTSHWPQTGHVLVTSQLLAKDWPFYQDAESQAIFGGTEGDTGAEGTRTR
jgi:hypothetical protein